MTRHCNFCNKSSSEVQKLVAGPNLGRDTVYICNECIDLGYHAIHDRVRKSPTDKITPAEIKNYLDQYVIGQDSAKMSLSVAVYNHYKRIKGPAAGATRIKKSNVLMVGPSGTGKTLLVSTLADLLQVPFVHVDATVFTETGYVGEDVESIAMRLLDEADGDPELASRGIVLIDEIDKRSRGSNSTSTSKDVSGEGVQQALLKLIEGKSVPIDPRGGGAEVVIDTTDVLFIAAGAFVDLDLIKKNKHIGFGPRANAETEVDISSEDLIKYGLIPEFVGRFPIITVLQSLDESMLVEIMTKPKNCLVDQYKSLFKLDHVDLVLSDEYIRELAQSTIKRKIGARGLQGLLEKDLMPVQFILPELKDQGICQVSIHTHGKPQYHKGE